MQKGRFAIGMILLLIGGFLALDMLRNPMLWSNVQGCLALWDTVPGFDERCMQQYSVVLLPYAIIIIGIILLAYSRSHYYGSRGGRAKIKHYWE